jgi:pimeloyl-ACP methyl ester carboxylesterase
MPFDQHVAAMADRGLRYVSVTRPGYGGSSRREGRSVADVVDDVRTVLDHLGIDRTFVLGWSGGGPHAIATAALLPERVLGTAVMAGVAPFDAQGLDWLAGMGEENVREFEAVLAGPAAHEASIAASTAEFATITAADIAGALGDLIDEVDRGTLDSGGIASYLEALFREAVRAGYWGMYDDDIAFFRPWGFDLGAVRGPVHIWQGAHDRMVPFTHGQWLAAHCGGACVHLVPEHGHLSLVVDAFPAILDELIAGVA